MPRKTRYQLIWDELRRFIGDDVRMFLFEPLKDLQAYVDAQKDRADLLAAAGLALRNRVDGIDVTLQSKAQVQHTHPRADVNGLPAILTNLDSRVTALETSMAIVKTRLGI